MGKNAIIPELKSIKSRLLMPLGLCAWAVVGCTSIQAEEPDPAVTQLADDVEVKVFFEGDCPRYVGDAMVAMDPKANKRLMWVAYDAATNERKLDAEYSVYFDPFKGKTDDSNKQGVVKSKKLDDEIPGNVLFKYTILGTKEGLPPSCLPLDPFFRIR